jgi:uncharacterized membrane protein
MTAPPRIRKAILTLHITTSVSWVGAVLVYLTFDITTAASQDAATLRTAYAAMSVVVTYAIVPIAIASVLVGLINALITPWGMFRHYWVLTKLVLTIGATVVLLLEAPVVRSLADQAESGADPTQLPNTLLHSIGGLIILLAVMILSVYKPRGLTRHGWRAQRDERRQQRARRTSVTTGV